MRKMSYSHAACPTIPYALVRLGFPVEVKGRSVDERMMSLGCPWAA